MNDTDETLANLQTQINANRTASYVRLRGGYTIALAGMVFWLLLGIYGFKASLYEWAMAAYVGSGMIFPVAIGFSQLFGRPLFKVKQAVGFVALPAILGMLLFWPIVIAAGQAEAYELIPLIMAIGMGIHWPVIGWSYRRTILYTMHAFVRAGVVLYIWSYFPDERLTYMPLAVAGVYAVTVAAILLDVRFFAAKN